MWWAVCRVILEDDAKHKASSCPSGVLFGSWITQCQALRHEEARTRYARAGTHSAEALKLKFTASHAAFPVPKVEAPAQPGWQQAAKHLSMWTESPSVSTNNFTTKAINIQCEQRGFSSLDYLSSLFEEVGGQSHSVNWSWAISFL